MCEKKTGVSQTIKSMIHGKPSRRTQQNSEMYNIFHWQVPQHNQFTEQDLLLPNIEKSNNFQKQQAIQQKSPNKKQNKKLAKQIYVLSYDDDPITTENNNYQINQEYGTIRNKNKKNSIKKNKINSQEQLNKKQQIQKQSMILKQNTKKTKIAPLHKKQNANFLSDRRLVIQKSVNKNIKYPIQNTRQLPNSAFTAYYGLPAFQAYGRCNSTQHLLTHNIMPYKSKNYPSTKQIYDGALSNINKIHISDHQTKKHMLTMKNSVVTKKNHKQRSSQERQYSSNDGLKFMNVRNHFINLLEEKKNRDNRVTEKVTECYKDSGKVCAQEKNNRFYLSQGRPAGIIYERGQPVQNIIYPKHL